MTALIPYLWDWMTWRPSWFSTYINHRFDSTKETNKKMPDLGESLANAHTQ